jgi:hypothetical protein
MVPVIPAVTIISLGTGVFIKKQAEINIIVHIRMMEYIFFLTVRPRFFLKSAIIGPRYLLISNLRYNLSELLTYNPAVRMIKGVVGRPGMKIPSIPKNSDIVPSIINIILSILRHQVHQISFPEVSG